MVHQKHQRDNGSDIVDDNGKDGVAGDVGVPTTTRTTARLVAQAIHYGIARNKGQQ